MNASPRNTRRLQKKAEARGKAKEFRLRCPGCRVLLQKGLSHGRTDEQIYDAPSSVQLRLLHMRKTGCDGIPKDLPPLPTIPVNVFCESCSAIIHTEDRDDALAYKDGWVKAGTPEALDFRARAIEARKAHIAATGCDGGPEFDISPGRVSAAAPEEMTAVAELLGVSEEEAASITADALDLDRVPAGVFLARPFTPARLDADRTAEPKTQLRTHLDVPDDGETHTVVVGGADTHVDLETGKRTPLREPGQIGGAFALDPSVPPVVFTPQRLLSEPPLPPGSFYMDGDLHKKGDKDCCFDIGRKCECGGRVHMQSVYGGIAYCCELCGSDKPGSRR